MTPRPSDKQPSSEGAAERTPPAKLGQVVVLAGELERSHGIVRFPLTLGGVGALLLRDESGKTTPLQLHSDGTATFVLASLSAGKRAIFSIERASAPPARGPTVMPRGKLLELQTNSLPVVRFQMQGEVPPGIDAVYLRGGYLHPLLTPRGAEVTGDFPESHRHQHGIFSAWTRTRFNDRAIDFWNMGDRQGKVDFVALDRTFAGPVFAGFDARLAHTDLLGPEPVVALNERWTVTTYRTHETAPPYFVVDLDSTQETATSSPLLLEQYTYGGFALRGTEQWAKPEGVTFLTSEGLDRTGGDEKKGRWCGIGGLVNGAMAGFAMLGHPRNFRAPQTFRIHPKHPYMAFSPIKEGPFTLEPGQPYVSRFRIVSFDGPVDRGLLERLWRDYATPPEVSVKLEGL